MLAAWTDYLKFWWWPPAIVIFIAGWIFGGGLLLRRSIRHRSPNAKADVLRCLLGIALAGAAGALSGLIVFLLLRTIGATAGVSLVIPALILGAATILAVGYVCLYATFTLSAKETLLASAPAAGAVLALAIVIGLASSLPSYYLRHRDLRQQRARGALQELAIAIGSYQRDLRAAGLPEKDARPPESLDVLVEQNKIAVQKIRPAGPDGPAKYFYLQPPADAPLQPGVPVLMVCELLAHDGGRAVLYVDKNASWVSNKDFEALLARPENLRFAEAFRAAAT